MIAAPTVCTNTTATTLAPSVGPGTVEGFTVTISCAKNVYTESGVSRTVYRITSVAKTLADVGTVGFVERSVDASFEQ